MSITKAVERHAERIEFAATDAARAARRAARTPNVMRIAQAKGAAAELQDQLDDLQRQLADLGGDQ